jgi:aminoglycoside phosphotransferase (APT) family kinase protein
MPSLASAGVQGAAADADAPLREPLAASLGVRPEALQVALLYRGRLADSTAIYLARDATGAVLGAVLWSAAGAPEAVAQSMAKARAAAALLPAEAASRVLQAQAEGRVGGRSFAVLPYCRPLSSFRPLSLLQRPTVRRVVLAWLREACGATAREPAPEAVETAFLRPLARLADAAAAGPAVRGLAREALARLEAGRWRPRHVLMHGDLWQGNLMVRAPDPAAPSPWSRRLCLIDWGGSQAQGYAMFDLVRAADALRVPPARLRAEVASHCRALGCEPADAASHLAAGLAHVHAHLGEFPLERFVAMAEACRATLARAMGPPVH